MRADERAEQVVADIKAAGGEALAIQANVANADEVQALINKRWKCLVELIFL